MTDLAPAIYASPELADLILKKSESFDPLQDEFIADPSVVVLFDQIKENFDA